MKTYIQSEGYRIDPAPHGVNLVNVESGGFFIYVPFDKIEQVINLLEVAKND